MTTDEKLYIEHADAFRAMLPPERFCVMAVLDNGDRILLGPRDSWHITHSVTTDSSISGCLAVAAMTGFWPAWLANKHDIQFHINKGIIEAWRFANDRLEMVSTFGTFLELDPDKPDSKNPVTQIFHSLAEAICATVQALTGEKEPENGNDH